MKFIFTFIHLDFYQSVVHLIHDDRELLTRSLLSIIHKQMTICKIQHCSTKRSDYLNHVKDVGY